MEGGGLTVAVERGATLRFSADRALHPLIVDPATHYARLQPLLRAWRAPNVRLTGGGVIDGGGEGWWPPVPRSALV